MKRIVVGFLMLMFATVARADSVSFEATVTSNQVSMDEVLQLTLTFTGVNQDLDPVSLPVVDGFTSKYLGPSSSLSIINGVSSSSRSFLYELFPNKIGKFQIPAITATVAGQTYTTKPIDVEVVQNSSDMQAPSANQAQAPSEESLQNRVKLVANVDQTNVYVNERVPLSIKLLINDVPMRDVQYPQFDQQNFTVDGFSQAQQASGMIDGVNYQTIEFKTNVYPNHAGDITLGPAQIQGNVLYKVNQNNNPFDQENNAFGDVFNGMFDSYASRPLTISSKPIILHVSALPEANRPADFTGAIGQFDFQVTVSPQKVKAGDPLTLKMQLTGDGNLKAIKMPEFAAPGFKSYPPSIKSTADGKDAEEVIIPNSANIKEVPAIQFSYFDPSLESYKTITQGPFAIEVTAPNPDEQFKAMGFTDITKSSTVVVNSFSIGKLFDKIIALLKKLVTLIWFWVVLAVLSAVGLFYFIWSRFQERLINDPAFARRLKAMREANQTLSQAEKLINNGTSKDFYGQISKALRDYLANKWHMPSAGLSLDLIISRLQKAKVPDESIAQLKQLLEQSDLVCFASAVVDGKKMQADLLQTKNIITSLEKQLK